MIEYPHINERQDVLQAPGQEFVGAARFSKAGRVIMGEDHSGGVVLEGAADDLPTTDGLLAAIDAPVAGAARSRAASRDCSGDGGALYGEQTGGAGSNFPLAGGTNGIITVQVDAKPIKFGEGKITDENGQALVYLDEAWTWERGRAHARVGTNKFATIAIATKAVAADVRKLTSSKLKIRASPALRDRLLRRLLTTRSGKNASRPGRRFWLRE